MKLTKQNYHLYFNLNLTPTQKLIIDTLLSHCHNGKDHSFPNQQKIASEINVCRHTVFRNLAKIQKIKIGELPFMIVKSRRSEGGTWDHNCYIFPWLNNKYKKAYIHENNKYMINKLIEHYEQLALQEMLEEEEKEKEDDDDNDNHGTGNSSKKDRQKFLPYLSSKIQKLSTITRIKANDLLKMFIRIGETMNNSNIIFCMDKYLQTCLGNLSYEVKATEKIKEIYNILIGNEDLYTINLDKYVGDVLAV
ncbi:helix-turn-helix domain-containing protein [Clostridium formicaceticum]|uniref:Helix-turn-helix domain-containing protein n=1 Tax=Clostridium formicaceticum TaxID=1497 RepID=A0AAC9RHX6_9CLOT|nr:helix-turn-helix domain-containing protein [Clostridium formicaceticum]AOY76886.1 hypothetical protein BJL90_14110 [Clostridium formicaceticum]ARE87366.1 hypothetical protein CLFO_17660 [Clostridium formicaceticum]